MRIALGQLTAGTDPEDNLDAVAAAVQDAAARGARVLVLPEATMARFGIPLGPIAQPLDGPWATRVRQIAAEAGIVVVAGMFVPAADGRVRNTMLIVGPGIDTAYDKIHLFDAFGFAESDTVAPGQHPVSFTIDDVTFGVATCYDLRFPGLFQAMADQGAQVMLVGASWGFGPGKREQWELLCRARALDSTSWLLACGQADPSTTGERPSGRAPTGIGFSSVISPLGELREQLGAEPGLLVTELDLTEVAQARKTIPVLANRRF
ncbi:carbon-nitrogen hydrolase family protein [Actinoalloteichus hymeniacidonis]|uniref:Amidohydrolase n=1 Tax=Actinoalloteichus hymeniacidonis TaxID=340345 RepID=A0AAC9HKZ7_9PSEU|nr:carbon-nitrogen hydrolase family protein [Actinoalloteichus hymeniacidonis]AOS61119.1 putative amidohydrolase [Actinoalloteichus hymeniacidonis]MBB5910880.1 putative amidohydrolase [Actinoalloteichus hymeniacidonis]